MLRQPRRLLAVISQVLHEPLPAPGAELAYSLAETERQGLGGDELLGCFFPVSRESRSSQSRRAELRDQALRWNREHSFWSSLRGDPAARFSPMPPRALMMPRDDHQVRIREHADQFLEGLASRKASWADERSPLLRHTKNGRPPAPRPTRVACLWLVAAWHRDICGWDDLTIGSRVLLLQGERAREGRSPRPPRTLEASVGRCLHKGRPLAHRLGYWPWTLFRSGALPTDWWRSDDAYSPLRDCLEGALHRRIQHLAQGAMLGGTRQPVEALRASGGAHR
jgi:hypothetical protein